jgi:hypothetical protein
MEGNGRTMHPERNYSSDVDEMRGGHSSSYDDYDSEDLDQSRRRNPAWIQRLKALAVVSPDHMEASVACTVTNAFFVNSSPVFLAFLMVFFCLQSLR